MVVDFLNFDRFMRIATVALIFCFLETPLPRFCIFLLSQIYYWIGVSFNLLLYLRLLHPYIPGHVMQLFVYVM